MQYERGIEISRDAHTERERESTIGFAVTNRVKGVRREAEFKDKWSIGLQCHSSNWMQSRERRFACSDGINGERDSDLSKMRGRTHERRREKRKQRSRRRDGR